MIRATIGRVLWWFLDAARPRPVVDLPGVTRELEGIRSDLRALRVRKVG